MTALTSALLNEMGIRSTRAALTPATTPTTTGPARSRVASASPASNSFSRQRLLTAMASLRKTLDAVRASQATRLRFPGGA